MDEINNPHDVDFREHFTRREIAQDVLRQHLPAELLEVVDLESLEISKDSDVSKELRASYSDLVYRLRWRVPDQAAAGAALDLQRPAAGASGAVDRLDRPDRRSRYRAAESGIAAAETLLEWSERILTAETPEAVFH